MPRFPHLRNGNYSTRFLMGFPGSSDSKESTCNAEDQGSIPGLGRFPGEGNTPGEGSSYPLQYSGPENSMDYEELDMTE